MSPRPDIAWSRQLAGTSASAVVLWIFAGTVAMAVSNAVSMGSDWVDRVTVTKTLIGRPTARSLMTAA